MMIMLIKYLNISILLTTIKIVRNYPEIVRDFKDNDYDDMTEIGKIFIISAFILLLILIAVPLTIKQEILDS